MTSSASVRWTRANHFEHDPICELIRHVGSPHMGAVRYWASSFLVATLREPRPRAVNKRVQVTQSHSLLWQALHRNGYSNPKTDRKLYAHKTKP